MKKILLSLWLLLILAVPSYGAGFEEFQAWATAYSNNESGDPATAVQMADETLEQNPGLHPTQKNYIRYVKIIALMNQGQFAQAQATAQEAVNAQPNVAYPYVMLSDMQAAQGFYPEALDSAKTAYNNSQNPANLEELKNKARGQGQEPNDDAIKQEAKNFEALMEPRLAELEIAVNAKTVDAFLTELARQSSTVINDYQGQQVAISGTIAKMLVVNEQGQVTLGDTSLGGKNLVAIFDLEKAKFDMANYKVGDNLVIIGNFSAKDNLAEPKLTEPHTLKPMFFNID